jgi:hypothetical protein
MLNDAYLYVANKFPYSDAAFFTLTILSAHELMFWGYNCFLCVCLPLKDYTLIFVGFYAGVTTGFPNTKYKEQSGPSAFWMLQMTFY